MLPDRAILYRLATSRRIERALRAAPLGERLAWRAASRYVAGNGEPTDVAYLHLAHRLAKTSTQFALATHDGVWFRYWMRRITESRGTCRRMPGLASSRNSAITGTSH